MKKQRYAKFGNLTLRPQKPFDVAQILNKDNMELDFLFGDYYNQLEKLTVIEAERQAALENLRVLTTLLQTKRLKERVKSKYKNFTL